MLDLRVGFGAQYVLELGLLSRDCSDIVGHQCNGSELTMVVVCHNRGHDNWPVDEWWEFSIFLDTAIYVLNRIQSLHPSRQDGLSSHWIIIQQISTSLHPLELLLSLVSQFSWWFLLRRNEALHRCHIQSEPWLLSFKFRTPTSSRICLQCPAQSLYSGCSVEIALQYLSMVSNRLYQALQKLQISAQQKCHWGGPRHQKRSFLKICATNLVFLNITRAS